MSDHANPSDPPGNTRSPSGDTKSPSGDSKSPSGTRRDRSSVTKSARPRKRDRELARLLDGCGAPIWVIGRDGKLAYFSAAAAQWLGVDADRLLGRTSVAGSPISADPMDYLAASLSPPPGLATRGTASLRIDPPAVDGKSPGAMDVRFVRLRGESSEEEDRSYQVIAVAGNFDDARVDEEIRDAVSLRQRLDAWRARHSALADIATAGVSSASRRLRRRLHVAASTRTHIGFFGPVGCGAESIASRVHHQSAPDEPIVTVEGPLMDAELLDATLAPITNRLTESAESMATAMVRGLDEMPAEAQHRLSEWLDRFQPRLRLLGLCGKQPGLLIEPIDEADAGEPYSEIDEEARCGLLSSLIETLSSLTVNIHPLASRVEDIPLLATTALDARRAAGEGTAERLSREAIDTLVTYPWPGNIDELCESIGHAMRQARQPVITPEHLPLAIRSFHAGDVPSDIGPTMRLPLDDAIQRFERQMIEDVLASTDGNRAEAARRLGISRARLIRRLTDEASKQTDTGVEDP